MIQIETVPIGNLKPFINNARTHSKKQIMQIARSIQDFGFNNPILVDANYSVIAGHGRLLAAQHLGLKDVPVICLEHMSDSQKRAFILADNKLAEKSGWNKEILKMEFQDLVSLNVDIDLTMTGFETPELDLILNESLSLKEADQIDQLPDDNKIPKVVSKGDLWQLGPHRLYCGDSLLPESLQILMDNHTADMVFTDPPYNVPVDGHVGGKGKIKHEEFAFGSGEMSKIEFIDFLEKAFVQLKQNSRDGSIHYVCMDWRHVNEIIVSGLKVFTELKNMCVWNKQFGGMGSLYRSQHELIFVFKNGTASHINNIELGKHGRNRSNVWDYPGVHISNNHKDDLKLHPTVKPVMMIADAIIDCSKQGDIILDCFGGSGSTLLAAERTRRRAFLVEYETKYCDVILYRFEKMTGIQPILLQGDRK